MEFTEKKIVQVFSELAEANRILAGITSLMDRQPPICWMITSAAWGEGKTTLTAGLGMLAARSGDKRVLAIDMNWYSPGLHPCFGLTPAWDLQQYDQDKNLIERIRPSGIHHLDILTAPALKEGGENSGAEYAGLARDILHQARQLYDVLLVDTASVFPANRRMTDPVVIGSACDATIMVVLTGVTPRQQVKQAQVRLESSGARVAGVVVNNWKSRM
jgi:Mrp family chromosome partitioning ATPase